MNNNKEFMDLLGISAWHKAGYTGKGIKIAFTETRSAHFDTTRSVYGGKVHKFPIKQDLEQDATHAEMTAEILHLIAPDAEIYPIPSSSFDGRGKFEEGYHFILNNGIHILNQSASGNDRKEWIEMEKQMVGRGTLLVTAAGNTWTNNRPGMKGMKLSALQPHWITVGAVQYQHPKMFVYPLSNRGKELDFTQITDWTTTRGLYNATSCSTPVFSAMMALFYQFYYEQFGEYPTKDICYDFAKSNVYRFDNGSFNEDRGWGVFKLPKGLPLIAKNRQAYEKNFGKKKTKESIFGYIGGK